MEEGKPSSSTVGYRNPPTDKRFKPGQSGNPRGRPKGTLNLATVLARSLRERVVINENGRRKVVTKLEAAVAELVRKATSGDGHAIRHLCQLVASAEERSVAAEATTQLSEKDQTVMENIFRRFQQSFKESKHEPEPQ